MRARRLKPFRTGAVLLQRQTDPAPRLQEPPPRGRMWACRLKPFRTGAVLLQRQTDPAPDCRSPRPGGRMWARRREPFRTGAVLLQRQTDPAPTVGAPAPGANAGLPADTLSHRGGPASRRRSYRTEVSHSAWAAFLPLTRSK